MCNFALHALAVGCQFIFERKLSIWLASRLDAAVNDVYSGMLLQLRAALSDGAMT